MTSVPSPSPGGLIPLFLLAAVSVFSVHEAQGQDASFFGPGDPALWVDQSMEIRAPATGRAALLSAILPGSGQWLHGQNRWAAYAAAEIWAWALFFERRREGKELQERYRDLAWDVARRVSTGPRTEGSWEYYEAMTRFGASGAYDSDPVQPGVQPEESQDTFNGSVWVLAQDIFLPDTGESPPDPGSPSYQRAFQYYLSRAYGPEFAWNWGTNPLYQAEYSELIRASDEDLRASTTMMGVILANHLLSAVDALVSGRLGMVGGVEPDLQLTLFPGPFNTYDVGFTLHLSFPGPYDP
jgi:hypothetical protein